MMADIERAEKELDFANRKIKQFEDVVKKLKMENEQLKNAKKGLAEDLKKLMAKRSDIENLQTTLMGIMSSTKKIDVDDLKVKLADSVRKTNRLVTLEEGWPFAGIGAEVAMQIMETAFDHLDAPPVRVTGVDVPMPYAANLEKLALPRLEQVVEAARSVTYRR